MGFAIWVKGAGGGGDGVGEEAGSEGVGLRGRAVRAISITSNTPFIGRS